MVSGISLANKCQLLFGFAVVVILTAALAVPWIRTGSLVKDYQLAMARQLADAWEADELTLPVRAAEPPQPSSEQMQPVPAEMAALAERGWQLQVRELDEFEDASVDESLAEALRLFRRDSDRNEYLTASTIGEHACYRYVRAIRVSSHVGAGDSPIDGPTATDETDETDDPLRAMLIVDSTSQFGDGQLLISRIYVIAAGLVGILLAVLVFYLILTKLILRPVRTLRETTERLEEGNLTIRSDIRTGDEFQQLSEAFNAMLDRVERGQAQLRSMNENLDFKVNELAEANVGLFESNRFKSEFLANVSHELRTPLNSIIGFAELLEESARNGQVNPKSERYLGNILTSAKSLLALITDLLDLAKIEAGRMEVDIEPTSVADLIEGLVGIMGPQAEAKSVQLEVHLDPAVPLIDTDPGKLQQILYNFLSNAIKFTPGDGQVTLSADCVRREDGSRGVRISVADTGPGIPEDMQEVIFEKFRQLDNSHTREHAGTGLGLAICRELARMVGATVSFVSQTGRGSTFFVDLPLTHQVDEPQPLLPSAPRTNGSQAR